MVERAPDTLLDMRAFWDAKRPLVYAWKRNNEYLYIGATGIGYTRFLTHNIIDVVDKIQDNDIIEIWYDSLENINQLEINLINKHQPKYNVSRVSAKFGPKSRNCVNPICNKSFEANRPWQIYCCRKCSNYRLPTY